MANITRETLGLLHEKLTIHYTPQDYQKEYDLQLKEAAKKTHAPGFRKGNIPLSVVRKIHGATTLSTVLYKLAERDINKFIQTEKINNLFYPIELPPYAGYISGDVKDYTLEFEIGLLPDLGINPKDITITRYKIAITDALIDTEIENMRKMHEAVDEATVVEKMDDLISGDLFLTSEAVTTGYAGKQEIELLPLDFLESSKEKIIGKKVGDFITINILEDLQPIIIEKLKTLFAENEIRVNLNIPLPFSIEHIDSIVKPALGEPFFKKIFPNENVPDEATFRQLLRRDFTNYYNSHSDRQAAHEIHHHFLDNFEMELPDIFIKKWISRTSKEHLTDAVLDANVQAWKKEIKWSHISKTLAIKYGLSVTEEDLANFAFEFLLSNNTDVNVDKTKLYKQAQQVARQKKFVEDNADKLLSEKVLLALVHDANGIEKEISIEDFNKLVEEHKHHH